MCCYYRGNTGGETTRTASTLHKYIYVLVDEVVSHFNSQNKISMFFLYFVRLGPFDNIEIIILKRSIFSHAAVQESHRDVGMFLNLNQSFPKKPQNQNKAH